MTYRAHSDDPTITDAKAGDPAAWQALYEHVGGRLVIWLKAQPHFDSALDADDIAHDAWVTAAGKIADFRGGVDDFTGWLFGIARNLVSNANRRTIRRGNRSLDDNLVLVESRLVTADQSPLAVQLDWIRGLLGQLSRREAQVVACLDVVGLDVAATSASLGISSPSVRVAHHRALRRLRTLLDDFPLTESGDLDFEADQASRLDPAPPLRVGSWT